MKLKNRQRTASVGKTKRQDLLLSSKSPFEYAEAYKKLRTNIEYLHQNNGIKKLIITSAVQGEGKTALSVNLAATLAENGAKVILLDCDLRNPSIHKYLRGMDDYKNGLTTLLRSKDPADSIKICRNNDTGISYIMAGAVPPNPTELLGSKRMERLLEMLTKSYDYVICDTPPAGIVTDAVLLNRYCDGVLFVVRQDYASKDQIVTAKKNLENVHANIIGSVLSCFDLKESGAEKKGYYYGYHYRR